MAPTLPNDHAETVIRYRLHCAFLGIEPVLAPNPYPRAAATTPNQNALWIADEFSRSPAAAPLVHAWLDEQERAFMGSEQGGYRGFWEEAVLSMVDSAYKWDTPANSLGRLIDWLSTYCAYAHLCDPGDGASRIPGPRLGAKFGRDGNRDKLRKILAGGRVPVGDFVPLDDDGKQPSDASVKMASRLLIGAFSDNFVALPRVLSPLVVEHYRDGMRAWVPEFAKIQGGPVWAVAADRHGREAMVSWRDVIGSDDWEKAKRWHGKGRKMPAPLSTWDMGPLLEVWLLGPHAPRRVDGSEPVTPPPAPPVKPPKRERKRPRPPKVDPTEPPPLFVWQPPHAFEELRGAQCRLCYQGRRSHPVTEPVPARAVTPRGTVDPGKRPPAAWGVNGAGRPL